MRDNKQKTINKESGDGEESSSLSLPDLIGQSRKKNKQNRIKKLDPRISSR